MKSEWFPTALLVLLILAMLGLVGTVITMLVRDAQEVRRLKDKYFEKRVHLKGSPSASGICTGVSNSKTLNILLLGNPPTTVQSPEGAVVLEVE